jgi:hypothetical protein
MATFYPIGLAPLVPAKTASHRKQMALSKSLAGEGANNDRPVVLKGEIVLNSLLHGWTNVRHDISDELARRANVS